jgi:hypothetical protein
VGAHVDDGALEAGILHLRHRDEEVPGEKRGKLSDHASPIKRDTALTQAYHTPHSIHAFVPEQIHEPRYSAPPQAFV